MKGLKVYLTEVEAMQFVTKRAKTAKPQAKKAQLANQPVENKVDMEGFLKLAERGREGAISLEHLTAEEIVERFSAKK